MSRTRICVCGEITRNRGYCDKCEARRPKRQNRTERDSRSACARGYDRQWRKLRLHVLNDQPICELCEAEGYVTPAIEVHHIKPIGQFPDLRLERSNLMALCSPCHRDEDERRRRDEKLASQNGLTH